MRIVEFAGTVRIGGVEYSEGERKSFPDDEAAQYIELAHTHTHTRIRARARIIQSNHWVTAVDR